MLKVVDFDSVGALRREPFDPRAGATARRIVSEVREGGTPALRALAESFGDRQPGEPLVLGPDVLEAAFGRASADTRGVLERTAVRIRRFAEAQRRALGEVTVPIPGGWVGLRYQPVDRAGCYAPGGRFPLPSSVLMTAVTARAAGVDEVWVASPRPTVPTLAAAYVAGADGVLAVGGAQAIAAMAYGVGVPPCDVVVGPGNAYVTAAKQAVSGDVAIDMLAGPSELVVVASPGACPRRVAADLLAQAEHDPLALPILVLLGDADGAYQEALAQQLETLPTAGIARQAVERGFVVCVADDDEAVAVCDRLAPEHLALQGVRAEALRSRVRHYGALFVGSCAAEVLGDYGAGPNHTLPTGGTARSFGALSVMTFLRVQTSMAVDREADARQLVDDAVALARLEGLEAHARAAALRR